MCDELEQKVRAKQATSVAHPWQLLLESWAELSSVYFQSLVERIPRICEAVIAAKGGHFDESKVFLYYFVFNVVLEDLYLV